MATQARSPRQPIESVDKAFRLLALLRTHRQLTVAQVSAHLGVARSTAHRLLAMLEHHGFARQDPGTRVYLPGGALLEIALGALGGLEVRNVAHPELETLSREVRETIHLVILEGPRTRVLDSVESPQPLRVSGRTGGSMPSHCTSAGKALLAELPFEQVRALLRGYDLERLTERSITTLEQLERELEQVRARGYATNFAENEPNITAVGVRIPVPAGATPAALAIAAPAQNAPPERIPELARAAQAAGERIAARMQGGPRSD